MDPERPGPSPDPESETFWTGLRNGVIVLQTCRSCDRRRFPRMPSCPYCGAEGGVDVTVAGTGTVYSWVRVERALTSDMAGPVPYCIATVDLDGGGRMQGRLEPAEAAAIGLRVGPSLLARDGWTELRFTAIASAAGGGPV